MQKTILAGTAAALALALPAAASAQDVAAGAEVETTVEMDANQQAAYDAWPADRRAAYDAWSPDLQVYFWSLTPAQQRGWWALTDDQRARVYAMTPQQRSTAWAQIAAQMGGTTATRNPSANTAAAASASGNMRFVQSTMVQDAPPPAEEYPVCGAQIQDNCINPREAGKNYGNVPLDYWPGRPASEIDGPLPAQRPND